jgi:dTDP-4-dehydrorhamnose reductase
MVLNWSRSMSARERGTTRPDVLVNCAAYNFVDRAEAEPGRAFAVNALGVRVLADLCAARGTKLVHFSTDYVLGLDAARTVPFTEDDAPGPVSVYGLSKLAGECTPSYTVDVAEVTVALIRAGASGLFHVTNAGSCTWHEFAAEIFRQASLNPGLTPITSAEYGAAARRPAFSVLSNAKLAAAGVPAPRPWPDALAAYLQERETTQK